MDLAEGSPYHSMLFFQFVSLANCEHDYNRTRVSARDITPHERHGGAGPNSTTLAFGGLARFFSHLSGYSYKWIQGTRSILAS